MTGRHSASRCCPFQFSGHLAIRPKRFVSCHNFIVRKWRLILLFAPLAIFAEDHWVDAKSGPFQVMSDAGDRAVREKLAYLEQFREALGVTIGKSDLRLNWPVRVLVFKNAKELPVAAAGIALGPHAWMHAVTENAPFSRQSLKDLVRIFLDQNTSRLPGPIEKGLIELFSTLEVSGTHITLGTPVPPGERDRDWARMHLLTVNPDYFGRTRVLINNLEQSYDFDPAYRNAYQKSAAQIEKEVDAYVAAGNFGTASVPGRALSPTRDIRPTPSDADAAKIAVADLLMASGSAQAQAAYTALHGAAAAEGLGLVAMQAHKNSEAKALLASAIESGSESPRAWFELGVLESDPEKARKDLLKAGELNPRWGAPAFRLAQLEDDPGRKAVYLKKAASLEPRNIDYWQALAKTQMAANNFPEAQKAWAGAERAAANPEERERIHQVRLQVEQERSDFEIAERKRLADERERDLQRVKAQSEAEVRAAEAAANKKLNPDGAPPPKAVEWWTGAEGNTKVEGTLQRFDCLGKQARLVVTAADGKQVLLLVPDPSQIVLEGGGEKTLGCGAQRPPRKVLVQYNARPDAKFRTAGDAVSIEFR